MTTTTGEVRQGRHKPGRPVAMTGLFLALGAFLAIGSLGAFRYVHNFWLYRGFAPPHDPSFVKVAGTAEQFYVRSGALGGRRQLVDVYLPPGYDQNPQRRYPVFYLLHGFPGRPAAFLATVKLGVDEDVLMAENRMQPVILAMPFGSTGTFTDKEWANGVGANEAWETFVARDVVKAIDARYRTIPSGSGRAIGGLSEGGYGAINIALHRPGEFHVVESWSGYELADHIRSIFGGRPALLRYNSPLDRLERTANKLRRSGTYFWFYTGTADQHSMQTQNARFARALAAARIRHHYFLASGGHNWAVWRANGANALLVAAKGLRHG